MQEVDAEVAPNESLPRQQSLSAVAIAPATRSRCMAGCLKGGNRVKSLADFEFEALFRDCCTGFFTRGHRAPPDSRAGGGVADVSGTNKDVDAGSDDDDDYKVPSAWQVLCRKVRAEARRNIRGRAIRPYRYDSLSYAMNFDDTAVATTQQEQEQEQDGTGALSQQPICWAGLP